MKIEILNRVKKNKQPNNKYEFIIELMGGDADATFIKKVLIEKDDKNLNRFIEFLDNCKKEYPNGKGGDDDYNHIKDYWLFAGEEYPDDYQEEGMEEYYQKQIDNNNITFEWENSYEFMGISSFVNYKVFYYDNNGIKYNTNINYNE